MELKYRSTLSSFSVKRRRDLIPQWMKPFIFLFLIFGGWGLIGIGKNILGEYSEFEIYGLESYTIFSILGVFIKAILLFKAITAFGLWMEKDWAIKFGIIDAVAGIVICLTVMFVLPFVEYIDGINEINIRFEIFLLVPYLYQLLKIKKDWETFHVRSEAEIYSPEILPTKSNTQVGVIENKVPEPASIPIEKIDKEDHSRFMPK